MKQLQDKICQALEQLDGVGKFQQDEWEREEGGGGDAIMREVLYLNKLGSTSRSLGFPSAALDFGAQRPEATGHKFTRLPWCCIPQSLRANCPSQLSLL